MTDFVLTELTVGLQFAAFAHEAYLSQRLVTGDKDKAGAVSALQAAKRFLSETAPSDAERTLIDRQLYELEVAIADLPPRILPALD